MNFNPTCFNFPQDFVHWLSAYQCFDNSYFKNYLLHKFMQDSLWADYDFNYLRMNSFINYYVIYYNNIHDTINFLDYLFFQLLLLNYLTFFSWSFLLNSISNHLNLIDVHTDFHLMNFLPLLHLLNHFDYSQF